MQNGYLSKKNLILVVLENSSDGDMARNPPVHDSTLFKDLDLLDRISSGHRVFPSKDWGFLPGRQGCLDVIR